jgi:hypothetical protein
MKYEPLRQGMPCNNFTTEVDGGLYTAVKRVLPVDAEKAVYPLVMYIPEIPAQTKKWPALSAGHSDKQYTSQKLFLQVSRVF